MNNQRIENLHIPMDVGIIFSRRKSGFFQGMAKKTFSRGPTVVKFHFTSSERKRKIFLSKNANNKTSNFKIQETVAP